MSGTDVFALLTGVEEYDRQIIASAMRVWAGRRIEGEEPRPIDNRPIREINRKGLCAYCYRPVGALSERRAGAVACRACADFLAVELDGVPESQREQAMDPFLERLGAEAVRVGIDPRKLSIAVGRAGRHV